MPQQSEPDLGEGVVPRLEDSAELRERRGPQVGALQVPVTLGVGERGPLGADVDLLPPIDLPVRQFAAETGVAAKLWASELTDLVFRGIGQRQRFARREPAIRTPCCRVPLW